MNSLWFAEWRVDFIARRLMPERSKYFLLLVLRESDSAVETESILCIDIH